MADAKMNAAWWRGNKAKTLSDKGDTVLKALQAWDEEKGKDVNTAEKLSVALSGVNASSAALKSKANGTLHKETIGYLETYVENCNEAVGKLKRCTGKTLSKDVLNLPANVIADFKQIDAATWSRNEESILFLRAMKSGKGTQKIFDEFVKAGSKYEINIDAKLRKAVAAEAAAGTWDGPAWKKAHSEIAALLKLNMAVIEATCATIEVKACMAGLRKM